jgi:hypothetical protein
MIASASVIPPRMVGAASAAAASAESIIGCTESRSVTALGQAQRRLAQGSGDPTLSSSWLPREKLATLVVAFDSAESETGVPPRFDSRGHRLHAARLRTERVRFSGTEAYPSTLTTAEPRWAVIPEPAASENTVWAQRIPTMWQRDPFEGAPRRLDVGALRSGGNRRGS